MSVRGWVSKQVLRPRGAWTVNSRTRVGSASRASEARNCRFSTEFDADIREGTSSVFTSSGKVGSLFNWISPADNHLIYLDGATAKRRKLSDGTTDNLVAGLTATRALSCSDLGPRLYFCGFTTAGLGTTECRVYDGSYTSGVPNVDKAFAGPLTFSAFTPSDGGAGECTKGTHRIGFVFQSRSGFAGKPSPVSGGAFAPGSITLNAQQRTISVSITLNTPADAGVGSAIYPIMTRADNPNAWFFVPDVFAILPASAAGWTQVFTISVSDEDLANRAEAADEQFNVLSQDGSGLGPFSPQFVAAYGKRMTYGVLNKIYASEIDDPQHLTEEFHVIQNPGQRNITVAGQFGGDYLIFGDRWTGKTKDTGDIPQSWPQPESVSDAIGTPAILGVEWKTGGAWIWVASEVGLFRFTGSYPLYPISEYQSDIWARINWAAAYCIQVADDVTAHRVHVAVPLDGATEPTHDLVFDYTDGMEYDTCDFSLDTFAASTFSSIRSVKEAASNRTSIYIGPSAAGRVLKLDAAATDDIHATTGATTAINQVWESGYVRDAGEIQSQTIRVGAAHIWIRGAGALSHSWKGQDGTPTVTPVLMSQGDAVVSALSAAPGLVYMAKGDLSKIDNFTFRFSANAVGAHFSLSGFRPYLKPDLWVR